MSGHSHSKKIKRAKELTDKKKGQMFSKMARVISVAVKEGGANPEMNPKLRIAIEQARSFAMPKENIERAIRRGTGEITTEKLEEVVFEAYGPGGIAIIIEGITDNKNRVLGEIKQILNQNNGKLVGEGAVRWLFEKRGVITVNLASQPPAIKTKEELELMVIEGGAEDIRWYNDDLEVYTGPENLEKVKKTLEGKEVKINSFSLGWVAKEEIKLDKKTKEACEKLFEALDENEAVQEIFSNLKV